MSVFLIAILFGLGASAWIYGRIYNRTGGNQKSALFTAAACGLAIVLVVIIIFSLIPE